MTRNVSKMFSRFISIKISCQLSVFLSLQYLVKARTQKLLTVDNTFDVLLYFDDSTQCLEKHSGTYNMIYDFFNLAPLLIINISN